MSDVIKIAPGFNNTGGLTALVHQPTTVTSRILYAARHYGLARMRADEAPLFTISYPRIPVAYFNDLNTQIGFDPLISGISSVEITAHLPDDAGVFRNFNTIIDYVLNGEHTQRGLASWVNVEYQMTDLVVI